MNNILIADDDALIRDSLKIIFELEDDFKVVGLATNGEEALKMCETLHPSIVLMDIRMPVLDGVLGTKLIKDKYPSIKVMILTTFRDDEYIKEAVKNGAQGYILKNQSSDSIIQSIRAVSKGNMVLETQVAKTLSSMINTKKNKILKCDNLTSREFDILSLIGDGLSNKEIAQKLYLTEGTVRNYVTVLLEKFKLRDRTQLAIYYVKNF